MMDYEKIVKDILFEEISKCNNFNYHIDIGNLYLIVNTKKLNQLLINNSFSFNGGIDSELILIYSKRINLFWLSYIRIWSEIEDKIEYETNFKASYLDFQFLLKKILEEYFKLNKLVPSILDSRTFSTWDRDINRNYKLKNAYSINL